MRRTSIEGENYRKRKRDSEDSYNLKSPQSFSKDTHSKFSFTDYKHSLNKVLLYNGDYNNVVSNLDDLWAFINKYEATLNRAGKPVILKDIESENNEIGVPKIYSKSHCINFTCKFKFTDSYTHNRDGKKLTKDIFESFLKIVAIYQDFKNKEKFAKLNKLRQAQRDLPVAQYRDDIVTAVKNQKVVVIAGDTGCGKSTQVPQYLHEAGFQSIACTQPRRIACVSLSKRVAFETLTQFQTQVGYQIRFEKSKTADTKICFITEGLLLRQMSSENMPSYDVIILDEIHERHLMGDFLLGVLKCLIHSRDDIKLVLMSATININLFEEYFAAESAAVIQVPGRLYPIDLHYKPIMIDQKPTRDDRLDPQPYVQIMQLIDNKYSSDERGDLLIFMSGVQEITAISDAAIQYAEKSKKWIVLQLHSGLSLADQDKVFDYPPEGVRKCIVSTNIAETSVTIDGIRFVVDSGKVKEMSYDPSTKMQRLKEFWISKASADQRKGRAGRTGPGVCYRIYSEKQFSELDAYSTPEIARVPLASLLLLMTSLGMSDVRKFPFLDAPPSESIENALLELKQHGAISSNEKITALGKSLSNLPVEVALAKALIIGTSTLTYHKKDSALTLAAALGIRSIYTTKAHRDIDCETARKPSESDHGDPLCLLSLYCAWLTTKAAGRGQSRAWCRSRGIEEQRLYELTKLAAQLRALLQDNNLMELPIKDSMSSSERIQRHGEIKQLRDMRRKHKQKSAEDSKKKKRLKLDSFEIVDENTIHDEDSAIDIRDIEFRMTNDAGRIHALISGSNPSSGRDLVTLKLVLCRALYPQIAVADEFNHCKSEQLFHTWSKPYVFLHPTSYFGKQPRVLQLCESEIVTDLPMGYKNRLPLSAKHQLLCYLSLLETTKPYIVNSMRMPAAQTLFLLAHSIDTNMGFTRIVCDNWLLLEFPYPESGMNLLLKATQLRKRWDDLINSRLSDANPQKSVESELEKSKSKPKNKCYDELQHNLSCDLAHYMNSEVYYTIKKLLPGDLKVLYVGFDENSSFEVKPNPFEERFVCYPHEKKGGVCVTDNIVYNCITDSEWSYNNFQETYNKPYTCSACDFTLCLPPIERLQHKLFMCSKNNEIKPETSKIHQNSQNPNAKEYSCDSCKDILYLTPVQILKHKKSCEKNK